jgi:H+/Cl- antiporter ClcA
VGDNLMRTRQVLLFSVLGAVLGIISALLLSGFTVVFDQGQTLMWDTVPGWLGLDPYGVWVFAPLLLSGLLVGVVVSRFDARAGHLPAAGVAMTGAAPGRDVPIVLAVALIGLIGGASLGPEAPLIFAMLFVADLAARRLPAQARPLARSTAVSGLLGALLSAPLAPPVLLLEGAALAGPTLYLVLIPAFAAALGGVWTMESLLGRGSAAYQLPAYGTFHWWHVLVALGIGVLGGAIGRVIIVAYRFLRERIGTVGRPIVAAVLGGLVAALVAYVVGDLTLFSGETELNQLIDQFDSLGTSKLIQITLGKMVAVLAVALTGFRGGLIFPMVFIGGSTGLVVASLSDGHIPIALGVACGMASVPMANLRFPLFTAVLVVAFTEPSLTPLVATAAFGAYVLLANAPPLITPPDVATPAAAEPSTP